MFVSSLSKYNRFSKANNPNNAQNPFSLDIPKKILKNQ